MLRTGRLLAQPDANFTRGKAADTTVDPVRPSEPSVSDVGKPNDKNQNATSSAKLGISETTNRDQSRAIKNNYHHCKILQMHYNRNKPNLLRNSNASIVINFLNYNEHLNHIDAEHAGKLYYHTPADFESRLDQ